MGMIRNLCCLVKGANPYSCNQDETDSGECPGLVFPPDTLQEWRNPLAGDVQALQRGSLHV